MTKYDVFYLLVMTSNVSPLVCFGTEGDSFSPYCTHGIAQVVVCHVFRCVVRIVKLHNFPVRHDFDGGRVVTLPKIARQPHLDHSRSSSARSVFQLTRNAVFLAIWTLAY